MPEMGENGERWSVECSSDEENGSGKAEPIPPPNERIRLYETLDSSNGPLPIQWNWPHGRRAPMDASGFIEEDDEEEESIKIEEKSDFDFDFDESATPILRKGKASGPKGSAKKKTSSFSGILSNMRRHRQQERMEKEQSTTVRTKR